MKLTPAEEWEALGKQLRGALLFNPEASALFKAGRHLVEKMRDTGLRLSDHCEDWRVTADRIGMSPGYGDESLDLLPFATLRRIGWIDQKGRVYSEIPPQAGFDGGSLTPLLIDVREG